LSKQKTASRETIKSILIMLSPFVPFITEELWERIGEPYSIHQQLWPKVDQKYLQDTNLTIAIQVNGKLRDQIMISSEIVKDREVVENKVRELPKISKILTENKIKQTIYVPGKIFNIVI
jgi:leucyl-tRNA synthetase